MEKFSRAVVKHRILILLICILLLIPSIIGLVHTRINYDMLTYLPEDMDTVKGQQIMLDDFGKGAFSIVVVDGMTTNQTAELKTKLETVKHVDTVLWYNSLFDKDVPMEILPEKYYKAFNKGDATLMAIFFDTSTSADETIDAIGQIRQIAGKQCFVTGMSALVTDLKDLCEKEEPIYVGLAVLLATVAMMLLLDSWAIPIIFLISIGMAILINLGSNFVTGEISYITKALSAVLQLGVTMDYSIFLWHSYTEERELCGHNKEKAMESAIKNTITAVVGSSVTTIAGFIALCFMSFTLGKDIGFVMAKGVLLGVIACVTTLPALILVFDKIIEKTKHRSLIPDMNKFAKVITKKSWVFIAIFLIILGPAIYGYNSTNIYYDLGDALPKDMNYVISKDKLQEDFDMATTHMILVNKEMAPFEAQEMLADIEEVDGVKTALGMNSLLGLAVPEEIIPESVRSVLKSGDYQLMLVGSEYKVASKEVNRQITKINTIIKCHDPKGMLIGEAACTKDMIKITDRDFKVVSAISILAIFAIIAIVLKSFALPFILVAVIEFAIFINLGIPFYTGNWLPFIAPICLSTIQLGATVDYAILMTTRYKRNRMDGIEKHQAVTNALATSIPSIIVSAVGFFAATFGVAVYSNLDIISSMCSLMARGAIVSMLAVIFILPSLLMLFDKAICKTTIGLRKSLKTGGVSNEKYGKENI
ncbi:MAG: MMPL family transporter [Anaerovoracaceae bacterium]